MPWLELLGETQVVLLGLCELLGQREGGGGGGSQGRLGRPSHGGARPCSGGARSLEAWVEGRPVRDELGPPEVLRPFRLDLSPPAFGRVLAIMNSGCSSTSESSCICRPLGVSSGGVTTAVKKYAIEPVA